MYIHDCAGEGLHQLATSFLQPAGEAPKILSNGIDPPSDGAHVDWTCQYAPGNLQDGDPSTAWVEGVDGQGVGEVVVVPCLDLKKPVEIWSGYGKSPALFAKNSRPKALNLGIVQAKVAGATQYGTSYEELHIVANATVTLRDVYGFQPLKLPDYSVSYYLSEHADQKKPYRYFLVLQLISVFEGSRWADTCISEVRNP